MLLSKWSYKWLLKDLPKSGLGDFALRFFLSFFSFLRCFASGGSLAPPETGASVRAEDLARSGGPRPPNISPMSALSSTGGPRPGSSDMSRARFPRSGWRAGSTERGLATRLRLSGEDGRNGSGEYPREAAAWVGRSRESSRSCPRAGDGRRHLLCQFKQYWLSRWCWSSPLCPPQTVFQQMGQCVQPCRVWRSLSP